MIQLTRPLRAIAITGALLAIARGMGETAPLLYTAFGVKALSLNLGGAMNALPLQIFNDIGSPRDEVVQRAWGAALTLVVIIMLLNLGARAVLMKGGHAKGDEAVDILFNGNTPLRLSRPRVETKNDHGTGCTLSAAIAACLARRQTLEDAVVAAKAYLHEALVAGAALNIGQGRGPVHHFHQSWGPSGD